MGKKGRATLSMDEDLKRKARAKAIERGSNLSEVVGKFLEKWIKNDPDDDPPKED